MRALLICLAMVACVSPPEERARRNSNAGETELLSTLIVRVQGGSVVGRTVAVDGAPHRVQVRAQSLDVRVEVISSGCVPETVVIEVTHLGDASALEIGRRTFLDGVSSLVTAARAAAGGVIDFVGDADDPDRTPIEPETAFAVEAEDGRMIWTLVVDRGRYRVESTPGALDSVAPQASGACAALDGETAGVLANAALVVRHRLRRILPEEGYSFAVWGNNGGHSERRAELLDSLAGEDLAFALVTGDLVDDGNTSTLREAAQALDDGLTMPWFATIGDRDILGSANTGFLAVLGASSFAFDAGQLRFVVLDSADATLEPDQYEALTEWLKDEPLWWNSSPSPPRRVVLTHVPPLTPYGTSRAGFKHRPDAARLIGQLVRADVEALITSHLAIFAEQEIDDLMLVHSGGAGTPMQTTSDESHHWLRVRVAGDCAADTETPCVQIERVSFP